jgi:hypothetical protein
MEYGYTYDGEEQNDYSESTETYDNQINQDIVSMTESEISTYEAPRTFQKEFLTGKWAKKANMSITGAKHKRNMYLASRDRNHLACSTLAVNSPRRHLFGGKRLR